MTPKRKLFVALAGAILLLSTALSLLNRSYGFWNKRKGDLPVYVVAAERMAAGEEIYRRDDKRPYTYPPFLALAFEPFALLPQYAHRATWFGLSVVALLAILFVIDRNLEPASRLFWPLLLLLSGRHAGSVFYNQSNDLLIALLVLLGVDAAVRGREALGAAGVGLAAAIKATPLLFFPVFLWQRRWIAAAGLTVLLVAATLLPDLVSPRDDGGSWVVAWYRTFLTGVRPGEPAAQVGGAWSTTNILNQNLAGTIYRLSTPLEKDGEMAVDAAVWSPGPTLLKAITVALQLAVLGLVLLATRARPGADSALTRYGQAGAVVCGMVLLSPMSSKSHFCVLLLPISFCLADVLYRRRDRVVIALLGVVFVSGTLTSKLFWGRELGNVLLAYGPVTLCALAALAATARVLLRPPPPDGPSGSRAAN